MKQNAIVLSQNSALPKLEIAGKKFANRLFLGTGKFPDYQSMAASFASKNGAPEMVTVALKRVDISPTSKNESVLDFLDKNAIHILPNTAGARSPEEAVRLARLSAQADLSNWIKLEVHPDKKYLLPDPIGTLEAAKILVKEGFIVLPYINADPPLAKRLEELGCAAVMPLGSPIGSSRGLKTREQISIIVAEAGIPVIVDAGLGSPSDAAEAMELGADAVLVNTAVAEAGNPPQMARAFRKAVEAGLLARLSGLAAEKTNASASSPVEVLS